MSFVFDVSFPHYFYSLDYFAYDNLGGTVQTVQRPALARTQARDSPTMPAASTNTFGNQKISC
jgi:hypothetical protein